MRPFPAHYEVNVNFRHSILYIMWGIYALSAVVNIISLHPPLSEYINHMKLFHMTMLIQTIAVVLYGGYFSKPFRWMDFIYVPYGVGIVIFPHVFSDALNNVWLATAIYGIAYAIGLTLGSCNIITLSVSSKCTKCDTKYWVTRAYAKRKKNKSGTIERRQCPSCKGGTLEPI